MSICSLSTSVVQPREVFSPAVRDSAAAMLIMHDHSSGDPIPSREERLKAYSEKVKAAI